MKRLVIVGRIWEGVVSLEVKDIIEVLYGIRWHRGRGDSNAGAAAVLADTEGGAKDKENDANTGALISQHNLMDKE